jgi:hypothetical protein
MWNGIAAVTGTLAVALVISVASQPAGQTREERVLDAWHAGSLPILRFRMDGAERGWALTPEGVVIFDFKTGRTARFVALPDWQWAGEPYGCTPDLVIGRMGEALVSSDVLPVLWRIDPRTFAVRKHELALDADTGRDVGFSRLSYSKDRALLAVSDLHGTLWRIDLSRDKAQKLSGSVAKGCGGYPMP